jgi:hypothetical protein
MAFSEDDYSSDNETTSDNQLQICVELSTGAWTAYEPANPPISSAGVSPEYIWVFPGLKHKKWHEGLQPMDFVRYKTGAGKKAPCAYGCVSFAYKHTKKPVDGRFSLFII